MSDNRREFEKWAIQYMALDRNGTHFDQYLNHGTEMAWQAWQAAQQEAEPVGYVEKTREYEFSASPILARVIHYEAMDSVPSGTELYAAPQPAKPAVPDKKIDNDEPCPYCGPNAEPPKCKHKGFVGSYRDGWNDCRAAMLAAPQPVKPAVPDLSELTRYDSEAIEIRVGRPEGDMRASDDGEWVRFEDVEELLAAAPQPDKEPDDEGT